MRTIYRVAGALLLAAALPVVVWGIGGGCDPACHIYVRNNYAMPIVAHHLDNPARRLGDAQLSTVAPGKRQELAQDFGMDGDIDNIQIEDTQGKVLGRLNSKSNNVVCKRTQPDYVWEVTVGH